MRQHAVLFAVFLAPALSRAASPEPAPESPAALEARFTALSGASSGLGTRTDSGGLGILRAQLVPSLRQGVFELRVPLRLERDQAVGTDLTETIAGATLEPAWRVRSNVKLGADAGVLRAWRLNWPDQYQRQPDGTLPPTDRYSYTSLRAGTNVYVHAPGHHHLRARWRITSYDYTRDPNFDEMDPTPTHLTPRDNVQNEIDLSWRYLQPAWALALRVDTNFRRDSVYPARRALTGTPVAYSHQKLNDYEPRAELELRKLARQVDLSLEVGWAVRDDPFEGYYSYSGPHPRIRAEWSVTNDLSLAAHAQAWWLTYGPNSKANTEDGKRLYDHRAAISGEVRYAFRRGISFVGEASWRTRTTNYPDYVPGVFPSATSLYDIRWDYDNYRALAGVEWRI